MMTKTTRFVAFALSSFHYGPISALKGGEEPETLETAAESAELTVKITLLIL